MDRLQEIHRFWNWLPAFRAVAETEHLPSAARQLCISPPALSRSLRLLETALGHRLFRRAGRRLELNPEGRRFLDQVREGMRRIHEGLVEIQQAEMKGILRISSAGLLTRSAVLPAMQRLKELHSELIPELHIVTNQELCRTLLQGNVDVAFLSSPIHHERLQTQKLGVASNGIYCGPGHALAGPLDQDGDDLLASCVRDHEFLAPIPDGAGHTHEGWPLDLPRRVALRLDHLQLGAEICAQGKYLAVLPDIVAEAWPGLRRLPLDLLPPIPLYSMRRDPLGTRNAVDLCLECVQETLASCHGVQTP